MIPLVLRYTETEPYLLQIVSQPPYRATQRILEARGNTTRPVLESGQWEIGFLCSRSPQLSPIWRERDVVMYLRGDYPPDDFSVMEAGRLDAPLWVEFRQALLKAIRRFNRVAEGCYGIEMVPFTEDQLAVEATSRGVYHRAVVTHWSKEFIQ